MKTKINLVLIIVVISVITAFTTNKEQGYEVGDVATDFELQNIDGKMVSLSDYEDAKGFIVIFVANEDRIIALDKQYKSKGYPVIAINPNDPTAQPDDTMDKMIAKAKEKGFTFPYLVDKGQKIYPQYGATKTPHTYILEKVNGKLIVQYIGAIDDSSRDENAVTEKYVEDAVDALLEGNEPDVTYTRAIGCSIKTL